MKTTKTFRLLAVLLALMLAFGAMPALAVEIDSGDYAAWTQSAVNDLYNRLMAAESYEDYIAIVDTLSETARTAFFNALTEEQQAALEEHVVALTPESEAFEPAVRFTKVGPLLSAPANGARMMRAAAQNDSSNDSGIVLDKKAEAVDGGYKITLEAYATGASSTVVSTEPVDIVLVLDVSGSMDDNMSVSKVYASNLDKSKTYYVMDGNYYREVEWNQDKNEWGYYRDYLIFASWQKVEPLANASDNGKGRKQFYDIQNRMASLKSAVNGFIDNVAAKSPDSSIAIVKFAGDKSNSVGNDTYRKDGWTYNYSQIVKNLTSVKDNTDTLKSAVNSLEPAGATRSDYGMVHAKSIIDKVKDDGRKKVVIMFTDGAPTSQNQFENDVANNAISASKSIKDADATVYTIGIFSGADGTPVNSLDGLSQENKYMHLVSSNYKNATSMSNTGEATYPDGGKSYFLSASSSGDLSSIFQQISQEVGGSTTELTETSVIKDIVTPYFDLPKNTTDIKVFTQESDGSTDKWKDRVAFAGTVTFSKSSDKVTANDTVSVSGFSFKDNWCGNHTDQSGKTTFHDGKKLVIEFTVTAKEKFLGGNGVVTNGEDSGIYDGAGNPVEKFDVPEVDVTIKNPEITLPDANVYLGAYFEDTVTAEDLKKGTKIKFGNNIELDLSKPNDNWGLESWQTDYVTIEVKVTNENGDEVTDFEKLTDDTKYKVSVSIKPKTPKEGNNGFNESAEGTIHVFKPELTFKDSTVEYKKTTVSNPTYYNENNKASTDFEVWKNGDKTSTDANVTMLGNKPELTLTYVPQKGCLDTNGLVVSTTDIPVVVTVKIGNEDVTQYTTFVHQACKPACGWTEPTTKGTPAFLLHVIKVVGDLKIEKTGLNQHTYTGNGVDQESAIFKVEGDNQTWYVAINGNSFVTLTGLKVGNYTVTELTDWTWRYGSSTLTSDGATANLDGSITVTVTGGDGAVTTVKCENSNHNDKWLGGDNYANNVFGSGN